ncbi:efflux RND transporter periplasmic adaptor subunit [Roseovarius aestuarii]|nr:efflux RND transporter periplasmic adaptor subunit [Roseovarius aestuarii]
MRKLVTLVAAIVIMTGSYVVAFGVPASVSALIGGEVSSTVQAGATAGRAPGVSGRGGRPNGAGATTVVVTPLSLEPYADILRAVGRADAQRSADVVSKAAGEVVETNLAPNRQVSAGEVLVKLDARTEVLNLEIAQAELNQAQDTMERYERLRGTGNSTVTEVAMSEANVALRLAQAKVGLAEVALDDRTIRAPISGRLGLSDVETGDVLTTDTTVVTIDDFSSLLIEFELPERSVGLLEREQQVLANTPSFVGRTFEGQIVAFDSRIDSVTRSVTVRAYIENPDTVLWPGMTFSVRIIHESEPLAVLPSTAITWSRSGSSVWIDAGGVAQQVPATILFRRNDQVWIEADIAPGTLVVTQGAQKLREGARIVIADGPMQQPETAPDTAAPNIGQVAPEGQTTTEEPT